MIVDCHVHLDGREESPKVLDALDKAGIDKVFLFAPYGGLNIERTRQFTDFTAKLVSEDPERLYGFTWVEPKLGEKAVKELERAVREKDLKGVKMIPHHWYPYEEGIWPIYRKAEELGVPIIFHSGILFGFEDSSRFCRPTYYEVMLHFPTVRFALAHVSWPWTDECIAVAGRFRAAMRNTDAEPQMKIDMTPGTPPEWRLDALRKALAYLGDEWLVYGSDCMAGQADCQRRKLESDRQLLAEQLKVPDSSTRKILGENALTLFKPFG